MKILISSSPGRSATLVRMIECRGYTPHSEIMGRLGMTRDELCDALLELSDVGFVFDVHPHAGVRFLRSPELLTPQLIADSLSTERVGRMVYHSFRVESTNSQAIELASKGGPEGTLLVTEYQERGRGRFGRRWHSPPSASILATLLLRPLPVSSTPMIVLAAALSVVKSLRGIGIDAYIRWPNDIIVHGKKICGILAETGVGYTVCGLGLNVNQNYFTPSLAPCATSATRELHKFQSRPRLLRSILEDFEENYDQLLGGEHSEIVERARVRLSSEGSSVNLLGRKTLLTGRISDMGETGHSFSERVAANCSAYFPKMLPGEVGAVEPHSRFPLRETGQ